jgi:hypothetical protein
MTDLNTLLDRYWNLAHAEGAEGRQHDTARGDAHACRREIERLVGKLEGVGIADVLRKDGCTTGDGTYVHASTQAVVAALSALTSEATVAGVGSSINSDKPTKEADLVLNALATCGFEVRAITEAPAVAGVTEEPHPLGAKQTIISEVWERLEGPFGLSRNVDREIIAKGVETALHILRRKGIALSALSSPAEGGEKAVVVRWTPLDDNGLASVEINGKRITAVPSYGEAQEVANRIRFALTHPAPSVPIDEVKRVLELLIATVENQLRDPQDAIPISVSSVLDPARDLLQKMEAQK